MRTQTMSHWYASGCTSWSLASWNLEKSNGWSLSRQNWSVKLRVDLQSYVYCTVYICFPWGAGRKTPTYLLSMGTDYKSALPHLWSNQICRNSDNKMWWCSKFPELNDGMIHSPVVLQFSHGPLRNVHSVWCQSHRLWLWRSPAGIAGAVPQGCAIDPTIQNSNSKTFKHTHVHAHTHTRTSQESKTADWQCPEQRSKHT